jgi:hypothetical protein
MNNEPKCGNKEPHSHLVAGRTFECEKGQQENTMTYDKSKYFSITEKPFILNRVWLSVGGSSLWQKIKGHLFIIFKR